MIEPKVILSAHPLCIRYLAGRSDNLVVSFSGVGTSRRKEPDIEFCGTASARGANHVLFVTDISRCWLNHETMAEQIVASIDQVVAQAGIKRVYAVGNSMGATMALHLSRMYPFEKVLALVPQYSAHPDFVPEETRWAWFRDRIQTHRFPIVEALRPDRTGYVILHGGDVSEQWHALRFPTVPGVSHFVLPDFTHRLARELKDRGKLGPVVRHALTGREGRLGKVLRRLGAQPRDVFAAGIGATIGPARDIADAA